VRAHDDEILRQRVAYAAEGLQLHARTGYERNAGGTHNPIERPCPRIDSIDEIILPGAYTTSCPIELSGPSITAGAPGNRSTDAHWSGYRHTGARVDVKNQLVAAVTMLVPGFNPEEPDSPPEY